MRTRGNIYKVAVTLLTLFLLGGCQGKREVTPEETTTAGETPADSRGFDPLELTDDREVVPVTHPKSGPITGELAFVADGGLESDTSAGAVVDVPDEIDSLYNQAYRIQLFTAKVYGEAKSALTVAEEIFDRPVFLDYEVPYYKIRVGNFADRDKAEEYLMRVKTVGYTDAWVVAVNVRVQEASPLYDETVPSPMWDSLLPPDEENQDYDQPDN